MKAARLLCAIAALSLAPASRAQTLGVFADSLGTICNITAPYPGEAVRVYVVTTIPEGSIDGFTSAAFRIQGLPAGWIGRVLSTPGSTIAIGDPFGEGLILARSTCETSRRDILAVLQLVPASAVTGAQLSIAAHTLYGNCGFESSGCAVPCPHLCDCSYMVVNCACVDAPVTSINGPDCRVGVQRTAWGQVKRVFE